MKRVFLMLVLCFSFSTLSAFADTVTFNFEALPATYSPIVADQPRAGAFPSLSLTSGGLTITITREGGIHFDIVNNANAFQSGKPAAFGVRSLDPFFDTSTAANAFLINFSQPILSFSADFGDYGGDEDTFLMTGYSGLNQTGSTVVNGDGYSANAFPTFHTFLSPVPAVSNPSR